MSPHEHYVETICRGTVGTVVPVLAAIISNLAELEQWLRISSLLIGIGVGALTIRSLIRKKE